MEHVSRLQGNSGIHSDVSPANSTGALLSKRVCRLSLSGRYNPNSVRLSHRRPSLISL